MRESCAVLCVYIVKQSIFIKKKKEYEFQGRCSKLDANLLLTSIVSSDGEIQQQLNNLETYGMKKHGVANSI